MKSSGRRQTKSVDKQQSIHQQSLQPSASALDQDELLARDMQLAFALQAREEQKALRKGRKKASDIAHHNSAVDGFDKSKLNSDHMLFVSCTLDRTPDVKLLVDTGASSSAMSLDMVKSLGMESKLNTSVYGSARGVGSSSILGIVENVEALIGHVEFRLFFMVIDSSLPCCILGLDQMRRFKCQLDLDDNVLVFGGKGGVSVPFLSQHEAMAVAQQMIAASNMAPTSAAAAAASAAAVTRRQEQSQYSLEDHIKSFFKL
jgi:hypothetical protein